MSDQFLYTTPLDPRAKPLIDDLIHEYDSRYGDFFDREGAVVELNRYPPEAFAPPHGNFLLLVRNGATIAGGAFKRYDEQTAELKRVWTRRDLRRQGLAARVLVELERRAQRQGYARLYLTTGCRQPEAKGLYLTNGYTALFDVDGDLEAIRHLPFEKLLLSPQCEQVDSASASASLS
ncbi:GNAT family N-acetyltransferase [Chelatococcus asaccharovorans]|uniref:Acetyltransferase (GNAT) family protein n=1 Tax=Chelatococcus asaccharovorans TaxID=28210 RepID=A0A2V3U761_9HYPH|nr:GNAT family N-acetyltransferase [Chelatococcus asaccharovorans]MBS7703782.1 GNAT family N-acetyltransferase [Chelatococcus asaccharovorans]PXW57942.1 acetyltransferase (GNAT) family protein [Chelatococcus asaccharovorans]